MVKTYRIIALIALSSFLLTSYLSSANAQTLVPGIHGMSIVQGVKFTWVIISSDRQISINLRYNGTSTPPPVTIVATALTNNLQNQSNAPTTMGGSQVLDAGWISPNSLTIKVDGSSPLYDADLVTVVASPYGSSPPPISTSPTATEEPTEAPSTTGTDEETEETDQGRDCDSSYPDFCIPSPPPDRDCGEISQKGFRVQGSDPHGFDRDSDGIGCE